MSMNSFLINIRKYTIAFCVAVFIAFFLVTVVSLLPDSLVESNVLLSKDLIGKDIERLGVFSSLNASLDHFSENYMLSLCIRDETPGIFGPAMSMQGYARYWHGYTVLLKPLLIFTDITGIYYFNMFIFYGLLIWLLYLMAQRLHPAYAVALLFAMIPAHFYIIPICMQYFSVFIVSFITAIIILKKENLDYGMLFLIVGCLTSFFDFLTAPLITLILPLSILLLKNRKSAKGSLKLLVYLSLLWGIGYGLLWASKWLIGSLILHRNVLLEATGRIELRTGTYESSRIISVIGTVNQYFGGKTLYTGIAIGLEIPPLIYLISKKDKAIPWKLVIQIMPMLWYFVLANHSLMHDYMTYRYVIIIVFLELTMWIDAWEILKEMDKVKQ